MLEVLKFIKKCSKFENAIGNFYKWQLDNGKIFTDIDEKTSRGLSEKYRCKIKNCYNNCMIIALVNDDLEYYEGYVYSENLILLEHAWLVKDNKVIDPTLAISKSRFNQQIKKYAIKKYAIKKYAIKKRNSSLTLGTQYYGVRIPKDKLSEIALKKSHVNYLTPYYNQQKKEIVKN